MRLLILFMIWAVSDYTGSAPISQHGGTQVLQKSTIRIFELDSNDKISSNLVKISDAELSKLESSAKDKRNLNMGRQVKMDDYELLKERRTILDRGDVDLIVNLVDQEMEASKNWQNGDFISEDVKTFPVVDDVKLGDSDLMIYLEMKKRIIFMENQMRKHKDQHVAVKPFDKNLNIIKTQFQNLSNKIDSIVRDFIQEFIQHADKFLKEAKERLLPDDHNDSSKTIESITSTFKESNEESIEVNDGHFHSKLKDFWTKESEDLHEHHHSSAKSDSVMKSGISNSWFGWSVDVVAAAGFVVILGILAIKLLLSRRGSLHKVAIC